MGAEGSILRAFERRVAEDPGVTALVHLGADGASHYARADLYARAQAGGGALTEYGVGPGDVVLIAVEPGPAQAVLFLGALAAGTIPCLFPALLHGVDPAGHAARLAAAASRTGARLVVTDRDGSANVPGCDHLLASALVSEALPGAPVRIPRVSGADTAYLQLSSGTAGTQKVVPVTHDMILGMAAARSTALGAGPADVVVGWVPLYHDMGLVGGLLAPLVQGMPSILLSPADWLARPVTLMRAVHRFRGTMTSMPNFAFHYCVRRIRDEEMVGLRLDSWRLLVNGAEPVRSEAMDTFAVRFARWGFRAGALAAGYGLAEHTLTATLTPTGTPPRVDRVRSRLLREQGRAESIPTPEEAGQGGGGGNGGETAVVSCGVPLPGVEVHITAPDGDPLPERRVGEVLLRSPYVFGGYRDDPARTAEALRNGWLVTGDLGYLAEGQLYVCGRRQDLIIVGGTNLMAGDVEEAAARAPGVKPGRIAAFGVADAEVGSDTLVLVAELLEGADPEEVEGDIRRGVRNELGVAPGLVDFVPPGWILKTTSGKLARGATRERWQAIQASAGKAGGGAT